MINPFSFLRLIAWIKRGSVAMERTASALESMASLQEKEWEAKHIKPRGKMTEIGAFDYEESEKRWKEYLKSKGLEEYTEEIT